MTRFLAIGAALALLAANVAEAQGVAACKACAGDQVVQGKVKTNEVDARTTTLTLKGNAAATGTGVAVDNVTAATTTGKLFSIRTGGTEKFYFGLGTGPTVPNFHFADTNGFQFDFGSVNAGANGLWLAQGTPSTTNYTLAHDGGIPYLNGVTAVNIMRAGVQKLQVNNTQVIAGASVTFQTSTSKAETFGTWGATHITGAAAAETTNFSGQLKPTLAVGLRNVTCDWTTAGVGGTTGVVVKVRNVTDGTDLCSCTLGACTTAAVTSLSCDCNSITTAAKVYAVQLDAATDCATNPTNLTCSVEMAQ